MPAKPYAIGMVVMLCVAAVAAAIVGWRFAIFVLPFSWTGEASAPSGFMAGTTEWSLNA